MLRGLVIVIMALDHVRDFVMAGSLQNPLSDPNVGPSLLMTRWITHICAPVFVFLAGTSAGLMTARKGPAELGAFLAKRGLWLILVEVTLLSMALTAIVLGHNLLDSFWPANQASASAPLWVALHAQMTYVVGPLRIINVYPLLPWTGVMLLGFGSARLFQQAPQKRSADLLRIGLAFVAAFVVLRSLNRYGDPRGWQVQAAGFGATLMSFLNTTKYPPSLLFLLMTLGPAAIVCAYADRFSGWVKDALVTYGRVPFALLYRTFRFGARARRDNRGVAGLHRVPDVHPAQVLPKRGRTEFAGSLCGVGAGHRTALSAVPLGGGPKGASNGLVVELPVSAGDRSARRKSARLS
jgi:uncharacterized membrane protein